ISGTTATTGARIIRNHVGTDALGLTAMGNGASGIEVQAPSTFIDGNIVGGNKHTGIAVTGANGTVTNNFVGIGSDGETAIGNQYIGIDVQALATIGAPGAGNVVSGNGNEGIRITGNVAGLRVRGNDVGTDKQEVRAV